MKSNNFIIRLLIVIVLVAVGYNYISKFEEEGEEVRREREEKRYRESLLHRDFNEKFNEKLMEHHSGKKATIEEANSLWYTREEYKKRFGKYPDEDSTQ